MRLKIFDLLLPRETKFFDYLNQLSEMILSSCQSLRDLAVQIESLNDEEIKKRLFAIRDFEQKGDVLEETIIEELGRCFITPLDREDIHTLTINMDKSLDILNCISRKMEIYKIQKVPMNVCHFTDIATNIAKIQYDLIHELSNHKQMKKKAEAMHKLENQADTLFHTCMAELFSADEKYQTIEMTKMKELYELLEALVDSIDYVGKLVRCIKMKHG
jgi:uncharacterized protein Yka (UPF0111/DUF47 family)